MVQPPCLVALYELKSFPDLDTQVSSLRKLKNDIVGHGLRKELVVRHGLLEPLEQVFSAAVKGSGKRSYQQVNGGTHAGQDINQSWSLEDEVRLQCTLVLGVLANGGPAFVAPILASNSLTLLLHALTPGEALPRIVTATLRTLTSLSQANSIAELITLQSMQPSLSSQLFTKANNTNLLHQLGHLNLPLDTQRGQQQLEMIATYIATSCTDESARMSLVKSGILDTLAAYLGDFAFEDSRSHPKIEPHNLLVTSTLSAILRAISAIIRESPYRAHRLILSRSFLRAATSARDSTQGQTNLRPSKELSGATEVFADMVPTSRLLPKVLAPVQKTVTFGSQSFPALSSAGVSRYLGEYSVADVTSSGPFCVWLIYLSRSQSSSACRLAALKLLSSVNSALDLDVGVPHGEFGSRARGRERQMALLAVPLAVRLVRDATEATSSSNEDTILLKQKACSILARLIGNSPELQKAAVEAGAIKYASLILKSSFDPVTLSRPMWSAQNGAMDDVESPAPSSRMGDKGLPVEIANVMERRAGALRALAAITRKEDTHRKAVIDQNIMSNLIESLKPLSEAQLSDPSSVGVRDGNTKPVLLAACELASSLSRSVSLLRTSLIDAGIAKPILALLHHPDGAVQVGATSVGCNLVLDFSPMRQDLVDAGALRTLCDHARRSNPKLRLTSLWALKHIVLNAPKSMKIEALDELGPGWLVQAISGEQRSDNSGGASIAMGTANAAGEQVDLLNAPNSPDMDVDVSDEEEAVDDDDDGDELYDQGTTYHASGLRSTLRINSPTMIRMRMLRENEQNPQVQAQQEDCDIREQALDFIRNLINGPEESAAMIDHLNAAIGLQRIFELVHAKLEAPVTTPKPSALRTTPQVTARSLEHGPRIILSAIHIINHISAASSRHKQLLIAQRSLLKAWLPHFSSLERQIRVISVWTVINLTWVEDQSDREDARRRAQELRAVGIEDKVRQLANDGELDVRERTKTAIRQLDELLEGGGGGGHR